MLFSACGDDEEYYPNVTTDLVDLLSDDSGIIRTVVFDDGQQYSLVNPQSGYRANTLYRALCGYDLEEKGIHAYSFQSAYILRDSTLLGRKDATGVQSAWKTDRYINLHLTPLTQGGRQYWGFITDSIHDNGSQKHGFLSLYHNQNGDNESYTANVYASLPLDSITNLTKGDSITLRVQSFDGVKTWDFIR